MISYYVYYQDRQEFDQSNIIVNIEEDYFSLTVSTERNCLVEVEARLSLGGKFWIKRIMKKDCDVFLTRINHDRPPAQWEEFLHQYAHFLIWRLLLQSGTLEELPYTISTYPIDDDQFTREYLDFNYLLVANVEIWIAPINRYLIQVRRFLIVNRLMWESVLLTQEQLLCHQRQVVDILAGSMGSLLHCENRLEKSIQLFNDHTDLIEDKIEHQLQGIERDFRRSIFETKLQLKELVLKK